ncbi:MFS transporter [Rhodococcus erythropolis]
MTTSAHPTEAQNAALLSRLDNLEPGKAHRRLMLMGGLGYTFDSFDGALMGYALSALIIIWHIPSETGGWLLSSIFFGYLVGALVAGVLADRFGRRKLMMSSLLIFCVCSLLMGTANSLPELFVWRALAGVGIGAETALIAPYISEFLPARVRGKFVTRTVGFLAFGYILAGVVAPLVISPNPAVGWRIAAVLCALPVVLLLWWRRKLPESPRYLLSKGRNAEAAAVVENMERESGVNPAVDSPDAFDTVTDPPQSSPSVTSRRGVLAPLAGLWRGGLARTTLVIWLLWFVLIGVNYGFSSWLPTLLVLEKGITLTNSFLIGLITSLAQIPGYYVASLLIDKMERKWLLAIYALGATGGAVVVAFADNTPVLVLGSALLAAFTNGAAGVYYTYTAELYPTEIRATAMGAASAVGRLGAIFAPIAIGYLFARIGWVDVFLVLVGALVLAVAVVVLFGARTSGRSLNESVPAGH